MGQKDSRQEFMPIRRLLFLVEVSAVVAYCLLMCMAGMSNLFNLFRSQLSPLSQSERESIQSFLEYFFQGYYFILLVSAVVLACLFFYCFSMIWAYRSIKNSLFLSHTKSRFGPVLSTLALCYPGLNVLMILLVFSRVLKKSVLPNKPLKGFMFPFALWWRWGTAIVCFPILDWLNTFLQEKIYEPFPFLHDLWVAGRFNIALLLTPLLVLILWGSLLKLITNLQEEKLAWFDGQKMICQICEEKYSSEYNHCCPVCGTENEKQALSSPV